MLNILIDENKTLETIKRTVDLLKKHTSQLTEAKKEIDNERFNISIISEKNLKFTKKTKKLLKDIKEICEKNKKAFNKLDSELWYIHVENINIETRHNKA